GMIVAISRGEREDKVPLKAPRKGLYIFFGPLFAIGGIWLTGQAVVDLAIPPHVVSGTVVTITALRSGAVCLGDPDFVEIDERWFCATADISRLLTVGQRVEVNVSAGSNYIVAVNGAVP